MKTIFLILFVSTLIVEAQTFEGTSNAVKVEVVNTNLAAAPTTLESLGITKVPNYYALVIGVSEYENSGPSLQNLDMPAKDAERFADILTDKYAFNKENVALLKNATREEIIAELERLAESVTEKDNLLVFYAGHGVYDKAKDFGYWLPADAKVNAKSSWIANSTIKDYMAAIKSKHTLLITDACFGGSIFKTRSVDASAVKRISELYKDKSRRAMTSGNLTEVPDQSVFLKFLLKTLDENPDPYLPASLLFSKIYAPILDNSPSTPQWGVIQGAGDEGGDFIFFKKLQN
jgi:hypothetical protein